jgi:hypothetical protein
MVKYLTIPVTAFAQSQMFGFAPAMLFKPTRWLHDDDTVFSPGHGPESTFGRERRSNPYVADL